MYSRIVEVSLSWAVILLLSVMTFATFPAKAEPSVFPTHSQITIQSKSQVDSCHANPSSCFSSCLGIYLHFELSSFAIIHPTSQQYEAQPAVLKTLTHTPYLRPPILG